MRCIRIRTVKTGHQRLILFVLSTNVCCYYYYARHSLLISISIVVVATRNSSVLFCPAQIYAGTAGGRQRRQHEAELILCGVCMSVDHGGRVTSSPPPEFGLGDANANCPLPRILSYRYKKSFLWPLNTPKSVFGQGSAPDPAGELTTLFLVFQTH